MCDEVVARIKESPALLRTDESRFDTRVFRNADQFHPDLEKHILCFDLIYCSTVYGLFHGISFQSIPTKERKLFAEKVQKAQTLKDAAIRAREQERTLHDLLNAVQNTLVPGTSVTHKTFGSGTVVKSEAGCLVIDFAKRGTKTLGIASALGGGYLQTGQADFDSFVQQNKSLLLDAANIPRRLQEAERQLIPYTEYLD